MATASRTTEEDFQRGVREVDMLTSLYEKMAKAKTDNERKICSDSIRRYEECLIQASAERRAKASK